MLWSRGTETSPTRWEEKVAQYVPLLSTNLVRQVTGQELARVLVFSLDAARRDWIAAVLERSLPKNLPGPVLAVRDVRSGDT